MAEQPRRMQTQLERARSSRSKTGRQPVSDDEIHVVSAHNSKKPRLDELPKEAYSINWAADIEKSAFLELRKITRLICSKETQIAEAEQHISRKSVPPCFNVNARIQVSPTLQNEVDQHLETLKSEFQQKSLKLLVEYKSLEVNHLTIDPRTSSFTCRQVQLHRV
jgi:hypothetical protein